jgi:DNA-(apurinic or apyrimidinic site) lyase
MINQNTDSISNSIHNISQILNHIPFSVWESIVENEPEWKEMYYFLDKIEYGQFAVLMIALGLNDYQLKNKADLYWHELRYLLENSLFTQPMSISSLSSILTEFYKYERLGINKNRRLEKFLGSNLARKIWISQPEGISISFPLIWTLLAETMQQKPQDKTIAFAMKCLGITLMMKNQYDFDYTNIPIPVDLRIKEFTRKVGFLYESDDEIRIFWGGVLRELKSNEAKITMIHLDSLIWQIGTITGNGIGKYFEDLNLPEVAVSLKSVITETK